MSDYDWAKNCAVVDRLFYMQYTFWLSSAAFGGWLLKDLWFIKVNWYADRVRARIPKYMGVWAGINIFAYWFLIWPLTPFEKRQQELKRRALGKYVYGLSMLDLEQDHLERQREEGKLKH